MKKLLCLAVCVAMAASCITSSVIVGSGHEAEGAFDIKPDYTSLSVSSGITVELLDTLSGEGYITADEEVLEHVAIVREGGHVSVSYEPLVSVRSEIKTVVRMPVSSALRKLDVSSAGQVVSPVRLLASSMEVECSSAARVDLDMDVQRLSVELSSAASFSGNVAVRSLEMEITSAAWCEIDGSADYLDVETTSAANLRGYGLVCRRVDADASSGSSIEVSVTEEFDASASSGGAVRYKGTPGIMRRGQSSGGSVRDTN